MESSASALMGFLSRLPPALKPCGYSSILAVGRLSHRRCFYKPLSSLRLQSRSLTSGEHTSISLEWSHTQGPGHVPLLGETIGRQLALKVETNGDKEAAVFCATGVRLTLGQLLEQADQLAAGLRKLGVRRGERVGIWGPNSQEWILTQYATARAGFILVNINPLYKKYELEYVLRKVGCRALIAAPEFKGLDYYQTLCEVIPDLPSQVPGDLSCLELPDLKDVIIMGDKKFGGTYSFSEVMQAGTSEEKTAILDLQKKLQFDDPINIQFTSGTTGFAKGATLSHHNILNNSYFIGLRLNYHKKESRIAMPVPLYHCFGMVIGSLQMITHGACVVFPSPGFDAEATLKAVSTERCTSLYGVPTMFIDMLNHPKFTKYDLSSLYTGVMAGSICPEEVMRQVNTVMHMSEVTVCYGTTETSPVLSQSYRYSPVAKRVSTVGVALDHTETKIINEEGEIVPIGQPGEVCTRGYHVMLGYWEDTEKTKEIISPSRWYHTGDVGVMDEEGYIKIIGRMKDLIIRGGENIYPIEIEELLYMHPSIKDVQVVGVPDLRLGEEVCCMIQLKDGATLSEKEVQEFCNERLARFKVPRYVLFVTEYPLTVTGKVQKYKLREAATEQLGLNSKTGAGSTTVQK